MLHVHCMEVVVVLIVVFCHLWGKVQEREILQITIFGHMKLGEKRFNAFTMF